MRWYCDAVEPFHLCDGYGSAKKCSGPDTAERSRNKRGQVSFLQDFASLEGQVIFIEVKNRGAISPVQLMIDAASISDLCGLGIDLPPEKET